MANNKKEQGLVSKLNMQFIWDIIILGVVMILITGSILFFNDKTQLVIVTLSLLIVYMLIYNYKKDELRRLMNNLVMSELKEFQQTSKNVLSLSEKQKQITQHYSEMLKEVVASTKQFNTSSIKSKELTQNISQKSQEYLDLTTKESNAIKNNISSGFLGKSYNKNSTVKLFGKKFVENNKNHCKILIENKKYELSEEFPLNNLKKVTENLEIKLVGIQNITDISYMFDNCSSLKSIKNIDSWDTSTIKLMVGVFSKCTSLKSLPNISNLNTKNVTDMKRLFFGCSSLEYLSDISRWNTENVNNMSFMFYECSSLKSLPDISKWNTSNVTNFYRTFYNCKVLISLPDISQWNTSNVTNMSYMFSGCASLKSVPDISKWSVNNVKNIGWMFSGCKSLISLPNISNWNLDKISGVNTIFDGCNK